MATKRKRKGEIFEGLKPYFGKAIARLRGKTTQEALAHSAGMDSGTLRRLEKGEAPLREDYIAGIFKGLEITYSDLLRCVADYYEDMEKEGGLTYRQMSLEEIFRRRRKIRDAKERLEREDSEIEMELDRRKIIKVD
jgi:transcriptional regulator with XRE-family HTH domain